MKHIFRNITRLFTLIAAVASTNLLFAGEPDSLAQHTSLSSEKILLLKTVWSGSANAASLQFLNFDTKIAKAYLNYNFTEGDFKKYQQANKLNNFGFYTNGYINLKEWKFYGDFNYFKNKNEGIKWTNVLDTYNDNPYILADSIGGTYYKEYFKMRGKIAWQINNNFIFGLNLNYKTGIGVRRKDPRPKNLLTAFNISPAIIFTINKIKLGVNLQYQTSKENTKTITVTDSVYHYFNIKGLGAFSVSTEKDNQSHESYLLGGGLQIGYTGNKTSNLTETKFSFKETDIKRGISFPLQVVMLENYRTEIASTFMFRQKKNTINKLLIYFTDKHIYGHEPVVEPITNQVLYQWETLTKYTLYWHNQQKYGVHYSYYQLTNNNHLNWGGTVLGEVTTSSSTYYFVPETNEQTLNYFKFKGVIEKEFNKNQNTFIISANGSYQKGFNSSYRIVSNEVLRKTVNVEFVAHDFDYFNQQLFQFGSSVQFGRIISFYKSPVQLFFSGEYKLLISQMNSTNRNILEFKLGINF
jgi:hypothetical protein